MTQAIKKVESWRKLNQFLCEVKDSSTLSEVLQVLLTIEEQNAIVERFLIIQSLLDGKETQRELAERLPISISKITRGANFLKTTKPEIKKIFLEFSKKGIDHEKR